MRHLSIILFVGLITAAGLAFFMRPTTSEESYSRIAHFDSIRQNKVSSIVPGPELLLVGDNLENYDIYKYQNRSLSSDFQTYYDLYGLPLYELYKEWLKYGGYIGSPLSRSRRELYRDCLIHSRYTYECQKGELR